MATFKGWGNERENAVDWGKPIVQAVPDALMHKQREWRRRAEEAARARRDWALGEDFFARVAPQMEELPMAPPPAMPMALPQRCRRPRRRRRRRLGLRFRRWAWAMCRVRRRIGSWWTRR